MSDETKTTRKIFLKWTGFTLCSGSALLGGFFRSKKAVPSPNIESSQALPAMARIRIANGAVARENA